MEKINPEEKARKEHEAKGHYVVFSMAYDGYLCYTCEKNLTLETFGHCSEEDCEYCDAEINWSDLKKSQAWKYRDEEE